jgi:hypothetical protein
MNSHGVVRAGPSSNVVPIPSRIASGPRLLLTDVNWGPRFKHYVHVPRPSINNWLSIEILSNIFLYAVEVFLMTPYQLVAVCRRWRNVVNSMTHLWSTLRLGTWTEIENVHLWLERSREGPLTVKIDSQRDVRKSSGDPAYAGLQYALRSVDRWQDLAIVSTPIPEVFGGAIDIKAAKAMGRLRSLELGEECLNSATLTQLLDHISKTSVVLSAMNLQGPYAISSFLQPQRHHILSSVTTLVVDGRGISQPVSILPQLVCLQTLDASHLPLPTYGASAPLPFLSTLKQLKLRAVPIQWMVAREFKCLEDCTIIHAVGQRRIQHKIDLPCCRTLTYEGHPISTLQYFHAPKVQHIALNSYDTRGKRVQRHLDQFCRSDGNFSQLHTLHLTLWCNEEALIDMLKYLVPLQELILSIAYPTASEHFLKSLAAEPSTRDWPEWNSADTSAIIGENWTAWHSSQSWHVDVLPSLKYLGIQSPKGLSQSECFDNCPLFRLVAWTRAQLTPPLEHLKVWEGRGTSDEIVVDYISTGYLDKHLGSSREDYDRMIVSGMVTQKLTIFGHMNPLLKQLRSSVLCRQLRAVSTWCLFDKMHLLLYLEQLDQLELRYTDTPTYSLDSSLPCVCTLQQLTLTYSSFSWMIGRTFEALKRCTFSYPSDTHDSSRFKGLQVDLPVCTKLEWSDYTLILLAFLSCPNVQTLQLHYDGKLIPDEAFLKFLLNCSGLQKVKIIIQNCTELSSLFQLIFCDALQQGAWKEIREVTVEIDTRSTEGPRKFFFNQMVRLQQKYEKWWNWFIVFGGHQSVFGLQASR